MPTAWSSSMTAARTVPLRSPYWQVQRCCATFENLGKGAALKTGFESLNGDAVIVTIDTDGQHDPADIPRLVAPILRGEADMVNGSRYLNGNKKDTPLYRRVGQKVLDMATNMDSGLSVTDSQSGFRAFSGQSKDVFRFGQKGLAIESEMLADAAAAGLRIKEVEIGVRYDVGGSSEHPVAHGVRVLVKVLHDMELRRPLYYFTVPGLLMAGAGIFMGLDFLADLRPGGEPAVWSDAAHGDADAGGVFHGADRDYICIPSPGSCMSARMN